MTERTVSEKLPEYEVYALKYATRDAKRAAPFIGGDPHDGPMPMDYFVWAIVGAGRTFILDTGFTAEIAKQRKRQHLRCPIDSLSLLGIDPRRVTDVILSHLHYDTSAPSTSCRRRASSCRSASSSGWSAGT